MRVKPLRQINRKKIEEGVKLILEGIGADLSDENFSETPRRVADFFEEILSPKLGDEDYKYFTQHSEIVILTGIRAYSLCPHHLLPVVYDVSVAYKPHGSVAGVSKIVRAVLNEAAYPKLQERFTEDIANRITELTGSSDVIVVVKGKHYCMIMRGVKTDATVTTVATRGIFEREKNEVYRLLLSANQHPIPT